MSTEAKCSCQIPPLFKYFGHKDVELPRENGGLKVLVNRSLKVTPPNEFNDPFEFSPIIRPSETVEQQIEDISSRAFFDQHFPAHPNWRSFAHYKECIQSKMHTAKARLATGSLELANCFQDNFLPSASKIVGVICFSSEATQPLMWAHYASAHTGLMLEFAAGCPLFQGMQLLKVDYPPDRAKPVYDPSKPAETLSQLEQIARRKSIDWKYESEYRVIVELRHTHTPDGSKLHFLPIDPSWILSVNFGLRCPVSLRTEVTCLLTQSGLKHIRLFEMRMHHEKFDLDRHEL
jgi:hypothetical protein